MEREDEIRMIAYALWVQEGHNHWRALEHWLRAEAIWEQNQKALKTPLPSFGGLREEEKRATLAGVG